MSRANIIPREAIWAFMSWAVVLLVMVALGEIYLRNSTPAAVALTFSEHNAAVEGAVGGDVRAQLNWIGSIHYAGDDSWASFAVQVAGTRASGTVDVTLQRERGKWSVTNARLVSDSGRVVEIAESAKIEQVCAAN